MHWLKLFLLLVTITRASRAWPDVLSEEDAHSILFARDSPLTPSPALTSAISTLSQLTTQPLCHRTASLNLIRSCATLDSKNVATVYTDSGPVARDFIDGYAASLAICDLRRGGFNVPSGCQDFTEEAISREGKDWSVREGRIEECLRGLAGNDATWGTWVSYRHRALGFCEAARWDREKERSLEVYRGLMDILGNLTEGMEKEVGERVEKVGKRFGILERTGEKALGGFVAGLQKSNGLLSSLLEKAAGLVNSLARLEIVTQKLTDDVEVAATSAVDSIAERASKGSRKMDEAFTQSLSKGLEVVDHLNSIEKRTSNVASKQDDVEKSLTKLADLAASLMALASQQTNLLNSATAHTENLTQSLILATKSLATLHQTTVSLNDAAAQAAANVAYSHSRGQSVFSMWPFAVCPAVTVVAGSYGLRPSAVRNLALLALGEGVAGGIWMGGVAIEDLGRLLVDEWVVWWGQGVGVENVKMEVEAQSEIQDVEEEV